MEVWTHECVSAFHNLTSMKAGRKKSRRAPESCFSIVGKDFYSTEAFQAFTWKKKALFSFFRVNFFRLVFQFFF